LPSTGAARQWSSSPERNDSSPRRLNLPNEEMEKSHGSASYLARGDQAGAGINPG
jgi:hypothetical protein